MLEKGTNRVDFRYNVRKKIRLIVLLWLRPLSRCSGCLPGSGSGLTYIQISQDINNSGSSALDGDFRWTSFCQLSNRNKQMISPYLKVRSDSCVTTHWDNNQSHFPGRPEVRVNVFLVPCMAYMKYKYPNDLQVRYFPGPSPSFIPVASVYVKQMAPWAVCVMQ